MSRIENGETINEGLCLQCAKELGIPQVKDLIDKMGITDDDIESMNDQMLEMMQNGRLRRHEPGRRGRGGRF